MKNPQRRTFDYSLKQNLVSQWQNGADLHQLAAKYEIYAHQIVRWAKKMGVSVPTTNGHAPSPNKVNGHYMNGHVKASVATEPHLSPIGLDAKDREIFELRAIAVDMMKKIRALETELEMYKSFKSRDLVG